MVLVLIILSLVLGCYSLFLIRKLKKESRNYTDNISNLVNTQLNENKSYLLEEINMKHKENIRFLRKELYKTNKINKDQIDIKHQQLISGEMKKLRTDLNKDLNDIVESVKNVKII